MKLTISIYTADHVASVRELNARLKQGGSSFEFPESPTPHWLPPLPGRTLFQEQFVVQDESGTVRGGFILKHQDFWVKGSAHRVTDLQLPLSEGVVNPKYHSVGVFIMKNAAKRGALFYGLGMGGTHTDVARTFKALGWHLELVPFFFRIERPFPFLRNIQPPRARKSRALALDALAFSGLGWLGGQALRVFKPIGATDPQIRFEVVKEFGEWADEIWLRARESYELAAWRDRQNLDWLYPATDRKFIKLRLERSGRPIGWAVLLNSPLRGHKHFGNLRVGTLVDCLALPGEEIHVVRCSARLLRDQGAELILTNQSSPRWREALVRSGFLPQTSNYALALSRDLHQILDKKSLAFFECHMTRGDGDGPIHLY